jgi:hypothetical protein
MSGQERGGKETVSQYPVELLQTFLENQSKELELRAQELELEKQRDVHGFEYSKFSTETQSKDFADARKHQRELWKIFCRFGVYGVTVLSVIVCFALYLGREQFVLELARAAFFGGFGAVAGSYYQKSKHHETDETQD